MTAAPKLNSCFLDEEFFENFNSEHTRKSYKNDLTQFFTFAQEQFGVHDWAEIERPHVIKYRNWLKEFGGHKGEGHAPKTIARKLAGISSYFHHLVEKNLCLNNPATSVKRPRLEVKTPTQALTRQQVAQLFTLISDERECAKMHRALLMLFFTSGLRKSEILNLKLQHYREINEHRVLEYIGKGGKIGQKLVHEDTVLAIDDYIQWMKDQGREQHPQDWLFQPTVNPSDPTNLNKPLNPKTINEILQSYAKKMGLNIRVCPHSARATFIGELLEAGVDIYSVAKEVNHSSVKTTQEYDKRRQNVLNSPVKILKY
jgi:site-specific recombinase XerD